MSQPLRTAVDPQALGAACTLGAAAVMAEAKYLTDARTRAIFAPRLAPPLHPLRNGV